MIPGSAAFLSQDFGREEQPTHTYRMDMSAGRMRGCTDGIVAMAQAISKTLLTERFRYAMYSGDYGIETEDLYGQPTSYVFPELERRIREALLWDDRVLEVVDFEFDIPQKGVIHVGFTVHTVFGDVQAGREVNV
ncbi:MAG: DUF2634 domain-containing protein [Lachnospiraceae bacterium]|nr:DUF2634 domain-containing protein [Lachnospiraceae bacterium]